MEWGGSGSQCPAEESLCDVSNSGRLGTAAFLKCAKNHHSRNYLLTPRKTIPMPTQQPSYSVSRYIPNEVSVYVYQSYVPRSVIHKRQKLEAAQMLINRMEKRITIHSYNEKLSGNKKNRLLARATTGTKSPAIVCSERSQTREDILMSPCT